MIDTKVLGRKTQILTVDTWQGTLVEIRQTDALSGNSQVFIDKELLTKLTELLKEDK